MGDPVPTQTTAAKVTLGKPPASLEGAVLWFEHPEREAFIAGFLCAGGAVKDAANWADSFMGCLRFERGNQGGARG